MKIETLDDLIAVFEERIDFLSNYALDEDAALSTTICLDKAKELKANMEADDGWVKFNQINFPKEHIPILVYTKSKEMLLISISVQNSDNEYIDTFEHGFLKVEEILYYKYVNAPSFPKGEE